jgi:hypothetical protein
MSNPRQTDQDHGHPAIWGKVLINWLLPGSGFFLCGKPGRGFIQAILVCLTFLIGLLFHGGVSWPAWRPSSEEFNLINNFSFMIQLGGGLPALISLFPNLFLELDTDLAPRLVRWSFIAGKPQHAYYELGSFYLVVAGAINYFGACNLADRSLGRFRPGRENLPKEARIEEKA